jgi:hypothetical protein
MPVHVEEMSTEVTLVSGDLPLSEVQIEKLVKIVLRRLQQHQREGGRVREATQLRRGAAPPSPIED